MTGKTQWHRWVDRQEGKRGADKRNSRHLQAGQTHPGKRAGHSCEKSCQADRQRRELQGSTPDSSAGKVLERGESCSSSIASLARLPGPRGSLRQDERSLAHRPPSLPSPPQHCSYFRRRKLQSPVWLTRLICCNVGQVAVRFHPQACRPSPPGIAAQLVAAKGQAVEAAGAAAGVQAAYAAAAAAFAALVPAQQLAGQGALLLVVLHTAHPLVQLSILVYGGLQGREGGQRVMRIQSAIRLCGQALPPQSLCSLQVTRSMAGQTSQQAPVQRMQARCRQRSEGNSRAQQRTGPEAAADSAWSAPCSISCQVNRSRAPVPAPMPSGATPHHLC